MSNPITINNLQEFEEYCKGKGELISVHETEFGYYAKFKTKVKRRNGFTSTVPSIEKGVHTVRLSKQDCNNQLILK
jgi:hypothetical protein